MSKLIDNLSIMTVTAAEWTEEKREYDENDFTIHEDVSIEALLEDLAYQGLSDEQLKQWNNARYGTVFDVYHITGESASDNYYAIAIGQR